jgi:hypothetical protein
MRSKFGELENQSEAVTKETSELLGRT